VRSLKPGDVLSLVVGNLAGQQTTRVVTLAIN